MCPWTIEFIYYVATIIFYIHLLTYMSQKYSHFIDDDGEVQKYEATSPPS